MKNRNASESSIAPKSAPDECWRHFLGNKKLSVEECISGENGHEFKLVDPIDHITSYVISKAEFEEIKEANKKIRDAMARKVDNTDYPRPGTHRWESILGERYLSIINKSAYTYEVQDIWDYRIWHPISEEEYMEIDLVNKKYDLRKKYREAGNEKKDIKEKGIYDYFEDKGYFRANYIEKLYDELSRNDLTVDTVPQYLEHYKETQKGVAIREEVDYYEQTIIDFLNRYKNNSFERTYIEGWKLVEIEDIIDKGNFSGAKFLSYSTRLQEISRKVWLQSHRRMYQYGYAYAFKGFRNEPPKSLKIDYIDQIKAFFKNGGTIEDLGTTRDEFYEKLKYSIKNEILENRYKGFDNLYFLRFHEDLLSKEELIALSEEAKTEWNDFLIEKCKSTINLEHDLNIFLNKDYNSSKNYKSSINRIDYSARRAHDFCSDISRSINNSKEFGHRAQYDEAYRDKIASLLESYILEGIQKIKTKERAGKAPLELPSPDGYKERSKTFGIQKDKDRDTRYLHVLYYLVEQKIALLKKFNPEFFKYDPEQFTRYNERESYKYIDIQDYLETYNHKKDFIIQRVNDVLADNLSFQQEGILDRDQIVEELSPELIAKSKTTLYQLLQKNIKGNPFGFYPVFLRDAMKSAMFSLFIPGYATVLKQLYPDDQERTAIRQQYIQTITKELILELQEKLLSPDTFSLEEYCMWQPLLYVYNRYGGTEDIGVDGQNIVDNYYKHMRQQYQSVLDPLMIEIEENKSSPTDLYKKMNTYSQAFKRMTFFFFNAEKKGIQTKLTPGMIKKFYASFESEFNTDQIALQLPMDVQEIYYKIQQDFGHIKTTILYKISSQRIEQNFNGRIKRMLENILLQKFGDITFSSEQIDFVYDYLGSMLEPAITQDLQYIVNWDDIKELNKTIIRPAINNFLENKNRKDKALPSFTIQNPLEGNK